MESVIRFITIIPVSSIHSPHETTGEGFRVEFIARTTLFFMERPTMGLGQKYSLTTNHIWASIFALILAFSGARSVVGQESPALSILEFADTLDSSADQRSETVPAQYLVPAASRGNRQSNSFAPVVPPAPSLNNRNQQLNGLVRQGRMLTTNFSLPPTRSNGFNGQQDDQNQEVPKQADPFGENQAPPQLQGSFEPVVPLNQTAPRNNRPTQNPGELPPDIFKDPFKNERRQQRPPRRPDVIPSDEDMEIVEPPLLDLGQPRTRGSGTREPVKKSKLSSPIDYLPARNLGFSRSQSNVYQPPTSRLEDLDRAAESTRLGIGQPGQEIYYVPAYEAIPGPAAHQIAPPANIYSPPVAYSPHNPAIYPPGAGWGHFPVHQPPQVYSQAAPPLPPSVAPSFASQANPNVYSPVIQPPAGFQGPVTDVRRGLLGRIKSDLRRNWGVGDLGNSACGDLVCQNADCVPYSCPVFYFGFQGAGSEAIDVANDLGGQFDLATGSAFKFALGRLNGKNLRTEVELSFRDNTINSFSTPDAIFDYQGRLQSFSGMTNAYWEFVEFPHARIKPYIGVGVGFISVSADLSGPNGVSLLDDDGASSSFAYQWMAGVNYKINDHVDLFGEYRFLDLDSFRLDSNSDLLDSDFGYSANSVGVGFRWKF